jgi:hypothetical protein
MCLVDLSHSIPQEQAGRIVDGQVFHVVAFKSAQDAVHTGWLIAFGAISALSVCTLREANVDTINL